jgi:hypothetical protein
MTKFTRRKGTMRLYDGAGTPWYLELKFDEGDFSGPMGTPSSEEQLVLHRGTIDANMHYIAGPDDKKAGPVNITFSCLAEDSAITQNLLNWLLVGVVNAHTLATTKGDTQRGGVTMPAFADSGKKCYNVEILWDGATDLVWKYNEVWFDPAEQKVAESDESVKLSFSGQVYGSIPAPTTTFTAGADVTA